MCEIDRRGGGGVEGSRGEGGGGGQCEELAGLAAQAGKQVTAEAEVEALEELEEEIDQRKELVGDLGRALRETIPAELKDRMEEAMKESVVMATMGRRYVDYVKTR